MGAKKDEKALLDLWQRVVSAHPEAAEAILSILRILSSNQK